MLAVSGQGQVRAVKIRVTMAMSKMREARAIMGRRSVVEAFERG